MERTRMPSTLKERVELLENQVLELTALLRRKDAKPIKDWRKTIGMSANNPEFEEIIRLGRDIRRRTP
jgi:hypothetical protein